MKPFSILENHFTRYSPESRCKGIRLTQKNKKEKEENKKIKRTLAFEKQNFIG